MATSPTSHEVQVTVIFCDTDEGCDSNPKLRVVMRIAYPFTCHDISYGPLLAMERSTKVAVHVVRPAAAAGPSSSKKKDSIFIWNDLIVMPILPPMAESAVLFFEVSLDGGATANPPFAFARLSLRDVVDEVGDGGGEALRALELNNISGDLFFSILYVKVAVKDSVKGSGGGHDPRSPLPPMSAAYGPTTAPVVEVTVISGTGLESVDWRQGKFLPSAAVWISPAADCFGDHYPPVKYFTKVAAEDDPSLFGEEYKVHTWNETFRLPLSPGVAIEDAVVNLEVVHDSGWGPKRPFGYGSIRLHEVLLQAGIGGHKVCRILDLIHPSGFGDLAQAKVKVKVAVKGCNFHHVPYRLQLPGLVDHFYAGGDIHIKPTKVFGVGVLGEPKMSGTYWTDRPAYMADGGYYIWSPAYQYDGGQKTREGMEYCVKEKIISVVHEEEEEEEDSDSDSEVDLT